MIRYYCSGFDSNDAFGHGLGDMFKFELKDTKSIVYIPGGFEKIEKAKNKYVPSFTEHFKNVGISFDEINLITPETTKNEAKEMIKNANFVMLMGGDPFKQKQLCKELDLFNELKKYGGIMLGISAGAMLMSKYIIITPCSEEYPDFHIEEGLNFDNISIYPHSNTSSEVFPEKLDLGDEVYEKNDLLKAAKEYEKFYLIQDYEREDGLFDISYIKSTDGDIELFTENNGKIWKVENNIGLIKIARKIR